MKPLSKTKTTDGVSKPKPKKVPTWLRRKREIEALRHEREELETRLLFSEMKRVTATCSPEFISVDLGQLRAKTSALLARQRRRAAEDENQRLKAKVHKYINQRETLMTTLATADLVSGALRVEMGAGHKLRFSGGSVLEMLERRVDARVFELDEAFGMMAMENSTTSMDPGMFETRCPNGAMGTVAMSRMELLPFDCDASLSAMWDMVGMGKSPEGEHSRAVRLSDDVYALISVLSLRLESGATIDITGRSVVKRFNTAAGTGTLIESCSEWTAHLPDSGSWTHVARESGCFAVREYCVAGCALPGMCQSSSELCFGPSEFVGDTTKHQPMTTDLQIEVLIPAYKGLAASRHQFVENTMFDTVRVLSEGD
ncbi:uncharacterized protein IUM83_01307 [Phytophthora cinnamomi]|uniref:uncharacterized protein n=1 Tax=Phytophthora cinnamomi TaxID=4785 RepID=UPI003559BA9B|nr:hypothetical protein IUM83_01307 [Phytophthora cinnamomi]